MTPSGTFTDGDPGVVVDLLDEKVLRQGILLRLFRRLDGVMIRPTWSGGSRRRSMRAATEAGVPQATISKAGLTKSGPSVFIAPPEGMTADQVRARVAAAGLDGPTVRKSFGQYLYDFPREASGAELVTFALAALRAIGADPVDGRWEYEGTEPIEA